LPVQPWVSAVAPAAPASILVDRSLVAPLAGAKNYTGYRCVYPHKSGYRGVVKWGGGERRENGVRVGGGRLRHWPVVPLASQAAEMVARWLRLRLGPRWAELLARHKRNLWRRHAPFRAWYSQKRGTWLLAVWASGRREEVLAGCRHREFRTWSDAADFVPEYMAAAHGPDWWPLLWR
jgi:hypothetical protein